MKRGILSIAMIVLLVAGAYAASWLLGWQGEHEDPGLVTDRRIPEAVVSGRDGDRRHAAQRVGARSAKQVLFGDLHVHTTFSTDAFQASLPMLQGEGAHPPADACDFARYCSGLDFWSINDHAEGLTPRRWAETRDAIRACNDVAGDPQNPDVVAFLGWEWTQVGTTPKDHYGHKNVVVRDTEEGRVPTRPIAAAGRVLEALRQVPLRARLGPALLDFENRQRYLDFDRFLRELSEVPDCEIGVDARELPANCLEAAATPGELFEKLAQWGLPSIVIPHGTSWGMYTPPGSSWDKQLTTAQHDPSRQTLLEVYSGHGNSEEYRDWRATLSDGEGGGTCPEPTTTYLPSCWRAGEIIGARCRAAGVPDGECDERAARARQHYVEGGVAGWHAVPGATASDWLDSGQCTDCFQPAFNLRPASTAQYMLSLSNLAEPDGPKRFRFGFIASSDNHTARPGTGYKEFARGSMSDGRGPRDAEWQARLYPVRGEPDPESVHPLEAMDNLSGFALVERERRASYLYSGGLVAAHAESRARGDVWSALERKEVYGTSGERMLLWFDLLNGPEARGARVVRPMGSEVSMDRTPRFRVRAVGAFRQQPGCPEYSTNSLDPTRLERLCRGECYHPSDERKLVTRIEVVRVRPRVTEDEPTASLIEDPWKTLPCAPEPAGCSVAFDDPEFTRAGRDTVYYVRAIQEPSPAINAGGFRCERDEAGRCIRLNACWGDHRTSADDDCLSEDEPRAWSSPIYVDFEG